MRRLRQEFVYLKVLIGVCLLEKVLAVVCLLEKDLTVVCLLKGSVRSLFT